MLRARCYGDYYRIDKKQARKLYQTGQHNRLYFCPVNLNPNSLWGRLWNPPNNDIPFDQLVTEYECYNCDTERGRYTAFYIPLEWQLLQYSAAHEFSPEGPAHKALEEWEAAHL